MKKRERDIERINKPREIGLVKQVKLDKTKIYIDN